MFCVFDATARRQVYLDILHDVDFAAQRERLVSLAQRYNNAHCVVETNSIGAPQFEELSAAGACQ